MIEPASEEKKDGKGQFAKGAKLQVRSLSDKNAWEEAVILRGEDALEQEDQKYKGMIEVLRKNQYEPEKLAIADVEPQDETSEAENLRAAFTLYIKDVAGYHNVANFAPKWQEKTDCVTNWHHTASYLRVFVSSVRLTAQASLVIAAMILAVLFLVSLAQAMSGKGALSVDAGKLAKTATADVKAGISSASSKLSEAAHDAGHAASEAAKSAMDKATKPATKHAKHMTGTRRLLATATLQEALEPAHHGLRTVEQWHRESTAAVERRLELSDAAKANLKHAGKYMSAVKGVDMSKITKAQILTIVFAFLIAMYSVPLLLQIAIVNGCFDRHQSLLIAQKEKHHQLQGKREEVWQEKSTGGSALEKNSQKLVDEGRDRFKKMLNMALESARENRTRFPLTLFGLIINSALIVTWVALAASPVMSQLKTMAPVVVSKGCHQLANSPMIKGAMEAASKTANSAVSAVNDAAKSAGATDGVVETKPVNFQKLFFDTVCKQMESMAKDAVAKADDAMKDAGEDKGGDERLRRLEGRAFLGVDTIAKMPDVAAAVDLWWRVNADLEPSAKVAIAYYELQALWAEAAAVHVRAIRTVAQADAPNAADLQFPEFPKVWPVLDVSSARTFLAPPSLPLEAEEDAESEGHEDGEASGSPGAAFLEPRPVEL